jgi:hypothetical protein
MAAVSETIYAEPGAGDRLIYVETTSFVSDDLVTPVQPVLNAEVMAAMTEELVRTRSADLTEAQQRQLEARLSDAFDPRPAAGLVDVSSTMRGRAEQAARMLGLTPGASAVRITKDDPSCPARGWGVRPPPMTSFAQASVLATWAPVTYPANGDWLPAPGMAAWLDYFDTDIPPRDAPEMLTLTDPLADLALWVGVTAERNYLDRMLAGLDGRPDPWLVHTALPLAIERLQGRRDAEAAGRPLWEADLRPRALRDGEWTMFACHARETTKIPAANLEALTARSARVAQ